MEVDGGCTWAREHEAIYQAYVHFCSQFVHWQRKNFNIWLEEQEQEKPTSDASIRYKLRLMSQWLHAALNRTTAQLPTTVTQAMASPMHILQDVSVGHARFAHRAIHLGIAARMALGKIAQDILVHSQTWSILVGQLLILSYFSAPRLNSWQFHPYFDRQDALAGLMLQRPLSSRRLVEIGVMEGNTSLHLLEKIPGLKLLGIDPYLAEGGEELFRAVRDAFRANGPSHARLWRSKAEEAVFSTKLWSYGWDTANLIFIDALKDYESQAAYILGWAPRLVHGGCCSGHDFEPCYDGLVQATLDTAPLNGTLHLAGDYMWWWCTGS